MPTAVTTSSPPVAASPITPIPTSEAIDGVWLYQLVAEVDAVGPSGEQRQAIIGGQTSDTSTTFWVGCSGVPAITTFHLGGTFDHV